MSTNSSGHVSDDRARPDTLLQDALRAHTAGDLACAARTYRDILAIDGGHADALNLLGVVELQTGNPAEAAILIAKAAAIRPDMPSFFQNLGAAHAAAHNVGQAMAAYRQAIALDPCNVAAHLGIAKLLESSARMNEAIPYYQRAIDIDPRQLSARINLGNLYCRLRQFDDAEQHYRAAVELDPLSTEAWNNLGNVCFERHELATAIEHFSKAVSINPQFALGYFNLGRGYSVLGQRDAALNAFVQSLRHDNDNAETHRFLGNLYLTGDDLEAAAIHYREILRISPDNVDAVNLLGLALLRAGDIERAREKFEAALRILPDHPDSLNNLGHVLALRGDAHAAIEYYERAVTLRPGFAEAHCNLGNALKSCNDHRRALHHYRQALSLKPDFSAAHLNMGNCLKDMGDYSAAYGRFEQAALLDPKSAEAHLNRGIVMLSLGRFTEAWKEYEWRTALLDHSTAPRITDRPQWHGEPLAGRRLLVRAEQGLGDSIQFVRYLPRLKAMGAHVILECQPGLVELFAGLAGTDQIIPRREQCQPDVAFDYHVYLLSLPGLFGTTLKTIPNDVPYLRANAELARKWRAKVAAGTLNIGLAWAGNPNNSNDRKRSCKLSDFSALATIPGLTFHSLQKGAGSEQAAHPPAGMQFIDASADQLSFADTAALIEHLDLVISIDSAVAHLAGAMGKPVWVLLHDVPDWRWLRERPDSPWYPSMRLYRQSKPRDWRSVFDQLATELRAVAASGKVPGHYYDDSHNVPDLRIGRRHHHAAMATRPNILIAASGTGNPDDEFRLTGTRNLLKDVLGEFNVLVAHTPLCDPALNTDHRPRDNSWHAGLNSETIDLAIIATEHQWHGTAIRPLVQRLLRTTVPTIYLGVGAGASDPQQFEQLDALDQLLLIRSLVVTVNDDARTELLGPLQAPRLPGPALFATAAGTPRTRINRLALSTQGISRHANGPIDPSLLNYTINLFRELVRHFECGLVCHHIDELDELAPLLGDVMETCYSGSPADYADIYGKFDVTLTTRAGSAGVCASLGIPGFVITPRAASAPGFLTEVIDPARDTAETVLQRLRNMDVAAASRRIIEYRNKAREQYIATLESALRDAGFVTRTPRLDDQRH